MSVIFPGIDSTGQHVSNNNDGPSQKPSSSHQTTGGGTAIGNSQEAKSSPGYPIGGPVGIAQGERALRPSNHFVENRGEFDAMSPNSIHGEPQYLKTVTDHRTANHAEGQLNEDPVALFEAYNGDTITMGATGSAAGQFRGSTTLLNPEQNPEKDAVSGGLEEQFRSAANSDMRSKASPIKSTSPLHPFTRVYARTARNALLTSYNRTKIPIADIEFRKAFRHIFITRPECYLMAIGDTPCLQAINDEDMNTCWARYPDILKTLSPVYVTSTDGTLCANWNYLLSNRVNGLNTSGTTLNVMESMTTATRGATVTPGTIITSNNGGSLDLSFRDTKYFDVSEMLRIWMLYIHKRRTGTFFPSFNGYQYQNGFIQGGGGVVNGYNVLHPYDRALDYCASIFDIVTDETGTKILYWCKYYGVYPTSMTRGVLSNDKNAALTSEATVSSTFRYQRKIENRFKTIIEFNYNAGVANAVGSADASSALSRSENSKAFKCSTQPAYLGAASMFTGPPYIMTSVGINSSNQQVIEPFLCFMTASTNGLLMNNGIMNE